MTVAFNEFLDIFNDKILARRKLSPITRNYYRLRMKHIKSCLGERFIDNLDVFQISKFLIDKPPRMSNQYRGLLADIFKHAIGMGYVRYNPALSTIPQFHEKKRQRMELPEFYAIHKSSPLCLQNAMNLALHTLQRRNDICAMRYDHIYDGYLKVIQEKTKKHGITANLKILIEPSLQRVIDNCRSDIDSPFLVHRMPDRQTSQNLRLENREHITQVLPDYLTKAFNRAREDSGVYDHLDIKEQPSFHEIRALGAKLYSDSGVDPQSLLGHSSKKMTDVYLTGHKNMWTEAKAGLILPLGY